VAVALHRLTLAFGGGAPAHACMFDDPDVEEAETPRVAARGFLKRR
jgi:hypothetical protein